MRRRLINSTLAVVLVVIAVFGVSLVIVETRTISASAQESVESEALRLISVVDSRLLGDEVINSGVLSEQIDPNRFALIEIPGRAPIAVGERPTGSVLRASETGEQGEKVTVEESRSAVTREVGRTLLIIGAVALLAIISAVLLAVRQANRLASPLTDLAETAERLGSGDPRPRHKRYGVPELDRVADVLDSSAERIARMLTAERRLAADASHQLRTPLTALSMRIEEISVTDDPETVKEEANIALTQVERLTDVVERLLTNSRDPRTGSAVVFDLDEVIKRRIEEWRPAYRSTGRALVCSGKHGLRAARAPRARSPSAGRADRELPDARRRHGRPAHPGSRQPGGHRGHRRGPRRPGRAGGADLRADDQRPQLHRDRPGRRPGPRGGGRRPAGTAPAAPGGLRTLPQPAASRSTARTRNAPCAEHVRSRRDQFRTGSGSTVSVGRRCSRNRSAGSAASSVGRALSGRVLKTQVR
ncbi:hypothetical protein SMICM17S_06491 [Streptomyces microflavus]